MEKSNSGIGIVGVIQIVFIILKLLRLINWSWLVVFSPIIISFVLSTIIVSILILSAVFRS